MHAVYKVKFMMNLGTFRERKTITFIVQLWLREFFQWLQ